MPLATLLCVWPFCRFSQAAVATAAAIRHSSRHAAVIAVVMQQRIHRCSHTAATAFASYGAKYWRAIGIESDGEGCFVWVGINKRSSFGFAYLMEAALN